MTTTSKFKNIDEYINGFPVNIREILQQIRETVKRTVPQAEETIKYDMPTFMQEGNLVHFAAFKKHIGFFPAPTGNESFATELAKYKSGKGSVQFPIDKPIPMDLIVKIIQFNLERNMEKAGKKKSINNEL